MLQRTVRFPSEQPGSSIAVIISTPTILRVTMRPASMNSARQTVTTAQVQSNVTLTAVDGNLFIRRGPHLAFNPIGVLYEGETKSVIGRDILSRWLQISSSSIPGKTGWISIQTRYSKVYGDLSALQVIDTLDWPAGAYLWNCTHHQMLAQPGDYFIPSSYEFPDNEITVLPGTYTIYDLEVVGESVMIDRIEVSEGSEFEIREDADGERRKCP